MSQFHFDPATYPTSIREDIPRYDELQEQAAQATEGVTASAILELGTGTGQTAQHVLERHPGAQLVGIDESEAMLAVARERVPGANLQVQRLEDQLPRGPFELVFSALAIHHLDGPGKQDLFRRVAAVLAPGGRFVLADVIVPDDAAQALIPLSEDYDRPDRLDDQLAWLTAAGFDVRTTWVAGDLAVVVADLQDR